MFRKNTRHRQLPLTGHADELPEPLRKRLQHAWAETFYRECFCRLDEEPFAVSGSAWRGTCRRREKTCWSRLW